MPCYISIKAYIFFFRFLEYLAAVFYAILLLLNAYPAIFSLISICFVLFCIKEIFCLTKLFQSIFNSLSLFIYCHLQYIILHVYHWAARWYCGLIFGFGFIFTLFHIDNKAVIGWWRYIELDHTIIAGWQWVHYS